MRSKPKPLRHALGRALARIAEHDGRALAQVWRAAVGDAIAGQSSPLALADGKLTVRVSAEPVRAALAAERGLLVRRLHEVPGGESVEAIELVLP